MDFCLNNYINIYKLFNKSQVYLFIKRTFLKIRFEKTPSRFGRSVVFNGSSYFFFLNHLILPKSSTMFMRITYKMIAKKPRKIDNLNIHSQPSNNDGSHRWITKTTQAWNTSRDRANNHTGKIFIKSHKETSEFKSSPCWDSLSSFKNITPNNGMTAKEI